MAPFSKIYERHLVLLLSLSDVHFSQQNSFSCDISDFKFP